MRILQFRRNRGCFSGRLRFWPPLQDLGAPNLDFAPLRSKPRHQILPFVWKFYRSIRVEYRFVPPLRTDATTAPALIMIGNAGEALTPKPAPNLPLTQRHSERFDGIADRPSDRRPNMLH